MRAFYSLRLRPLMLLVVSALGFILATTMLAAHNAQEPVGSYIRGTGTRVLNSLTPIALPARPVYVSGPAAMCRATPELAPALEELDEKWGNTALDMSVVFSGSGIRVRRALRKLLRGEPFVSGSTGEGKRRRPQAARRRACAMCAHRSPELAPARPAWAAGRSR